MAGIGKTVLLAEAARRVQAQGVRVLHAAGGELERDFPFGVVRTLLAPALDGEAPVALRAEAGPPGAEGDQAGAIADVQRFVAGLAGSGALLLVVDDVRWADDASTRCLAYLARRLEDLPLVLLAAGRESDQLHVLRRTGGAIHLRPAPLTAEATATLVHAAAPAADAGVCEACHIATGGTPLYVRELARSLEAHGRRPRAERSPPCQARVTSQRRVGM